MDLNGKEHDYTSYEAPNNWVFGENEDTQVSGEEYIDATPKPHIVIEDDDNSSPKPKKQKTATPRATEQPNKPRKPKAKCWDHYDEIWKVESDGVKRKYAVCMHCKTELRADTNRNGTSALLKHLPRCRKNPDNNKDDPKQTKLNLKKEQSGEGSIGVWKHDDAAIKKALLDFFVIGEHPFNDVEEESFVRLVYALNGRVNLPSRHTISRNVGKYYLEERRKLQRFLSNTTNGIHLTTDTWTSSCQRKNYMFVMAHFIDDSWVMHKRIINFREIDSHKGEQIGRELLDCIHGWGLKNVMTTTVDNAGSNYTALEFLVKKLPNLYEDGKHFHVKCMAHILNLVVKDGFKYHNYHVECVQRAVKYIRNSTQRITKFKKAMKEVGLDKKPFLTSENNTRWNSTFELLKSALDLQDAFMKYVLIDKQYEPDLDRRVPEISDFKEISKMVPFLEKFKTKTEIISASTKPVVHLFFQEILDVAIHLRKWETQPGYELIVREMRDKYDMYWGDYEKLSDFAFFAVLLDPTTKSKFLKLVFKTYLDHKDPNNKDTTDSTKQVESLALLHKVEYRLENLYKTYVERFDSNGSSENLTQPKVVFHDDDNELLGVFLNDGGSGTKQPKNELQSYLDESRVPFTKDFDILGWWKVNTPRYPIVFRMAKDILPLQISTVASEAAFSTCGRVLKEYRSKLRPEIVEALISTNDWVKKLRVPITDTYEDIMHDDEIALEIAEGLNNLDIEAFED